MIGLEESVADMVLMSRQIVPYDTYGVWRRSHKMPIEITVGTGSYDVPHKSFALTVFVHKDNPISRLTLQQLDGILGAQRTGGWKGMEWSPEAARSDKDDIRTWGQLGATGEWADKPIHPYGPPGLFPGGMSFFQIKVMSGADSRAQGPLRRRIHRHGLQDVAGETRCTGREARQSLCRIHPGKRSQRNISAGALDLYLPSAGRSQRGPSAAQDRSEGEGISALRSQSAGTAGRRSRGGLPCP